MVMKKWIPAISLLLVLVAGGLGVYLLVPAKPEYCWLVFGPEAKARVLVRLQGNRLQGQKVYIDRGGNDEFTGPEESDFYGQRYFAVHDLLIADPDNQITYTITGMTRFDDPRPPHLSVNVHVQGLIEYRQYCDVELASSPDNAKEAHFHGPLTVELSPKAPWTLQRGDKPTRLRVSIGTMNADKGCWVVVTTQQSNDQPAFPRGVHPVVDVEFPAKDKGPPIKRRYPLDEPC
jgi:hypothetical protein